ncbi:MAG: esterase [Eubacterium sp.]|nr:esterase [Eubacterium sp.]
MANISVRFFSNRLKRFTSFQVFLPNDVFEDMPDTLENPYLKRNLKTLFLLHGYGSDGFNWIPDELAVKYNFAVVIPSGENSFWLDGISTGHEYYRFLGEELVEYVRKTFGLAKKREDSYLMGYSMGGFGALHTSLAYPDIFSKAVCLSSALIVHEVAEMKDGIGNDIANFAYYRECFGEPGKVLESDNNPETLLKKLKESGKPIPEIIMSVGTEDILLEKNRDMHKFLESEGVEHVYEEAEGNHDMTFWNKCVQKYVPIIFE